MEKEFYVTGEGKVVVQAQDQDPRATADGRVCVQPVYMDAPLGGNIGREALPKEALRRASSEEIRSALTVESDLRGWGVLPSPEIAEKQRREIEDMLSA
jgi:hypothetical protein